LPQPGSFFPASDAAAATIGLVPVRHVACFAGSSLQQEKLMDTPIINPNDYRTVPEPNPFVSELPTLGKNEFLRLLTTQLENQDPLEPMKDHEFVAQLATFSSLEQLIDLNKRMDGLLTSQADLVNSQSLELIGRAVKVDTNGQIRLDADGAEPILYELPQTVARVKVEITDAAGNVVRTFEPEDGNLAGPQQVDWDGKDDDGKTLEPGSYSVRVLAEGETGVATSIRSFTVVTVDGVRIGADGLSLVSNGRAIPFGKILEITTAN
jgi:flagellar basal-body rod modification protein FlgD